MSADNAISNSITIQPRSGIRIASETSTQTTDITIATGISKIIEEAITSFLNIAFLMSSIYVKYKL